ncbi:hypothetical protein AK812_SmicGene37287 [Symbiodinium microadriaticum]|uniref:Uncharacterized protein n=1 Tax=Symbiodinium microadriaticum TaxID=2951 RepID=A0A1Q9CGM3_SYMMI|nr:hypothetical protein AK812_SmicGene37287 [Symbiodinium microadriaticum]
MASRAILRQCAAERGMFGSWSNASLLETKPRLVMNFSWAAVSSGAADLHCTPLQRRGFQSDCYLVATSSINMDARTRLGLFPACYGVEVENEVDQKVASFEKSTIESLQEVDPTLSHMSPAFKLALQPGPCDYPELHQVMTLLSVATSLLVGRTVAGPLRHLTDLMDKLSELDFELPENAVSRGARRSYIQDVAELEIARHAQFGRLARGIGMFARFVPETVRNIVSQGDDFATRLKVMMSVVEIYQGVVSEILGDGLIVLWNAPDHAAGLSGKHAQGLGETKQLAIRLEET